LLRQKKTVREEEARSISILLRLSAWALLCVLLILTSVVAALHIPSVQEHLLQMAVERLESEAGIGVQLESFRWSPFWELQVYNLRATSSGQPFLDCGEARLGYHLSWSWPFVYLDGLYLEKPTLQLERDAEGQWRIPNYRSATAEIGREPRHFPWAGFPWPQIRIVSGSIVAYQDGEMVLSIRDVNAGLSFEEIPGTDGPKLKINFGQWQGCSEVPDLGEWELTGEAEVRDQTLYVTDLELYAPKAVQLFGKGRWDLALPFDGTLDVQILRLSAAQWPALQKGLPQVKEVSGSLQIGRQSGIWSLDHDLRSDIGRIQGTLQIELNDARESITRLISRFSELQIPIASQTSDSHLYGQLEVIIEGERPQNARAEFNVRLEPSRWEDQTIQKGELAGTYQRGILEIKAPKIQSSIGDFFLSAYADIRGLWNPDHQGEVKLNLHAERASQGKNNSVTAQAFGGSILYDARYGPGDFSQWEKWQGRGEANLSLPQVLTVKASGSHKAGTLNLDYDLEVSEIQRFAVFFPSRPLKGKISSRGSIKGKWPDLMWDGSAGSPLLQLGDIQVEQASLKGKGAALGKDGRRDLALKIQNISAGSKKLGSLNLDLQQEADACRFNIRSEGISNQGSARLSGRLEKIWGPVRTLTVNQSTLGWKNRSASVDARIEAGKDGIHVQSLNIQHGKEKTQLAGQVSFDGRTDLKLTFEGIDIGQWQDLIVSEKLLSGAASGQIHLKGRTDQPEASVSLQLTNGTIKTPGRAGGGSEASRQPRSAARESLIDRLQLQGSYAGGILAIQGDLQSPAILNPVRVSAKIPMVVSLVPPRLVPKSAEECAFSVQMAGLQGEGLLPYLTFLEKLGGRIDLDAQGGGTISQPHVAASGSWRNGILKIKKWPHPIDNVWVDWKADSREITVQKGTMEVLGGHVDLKGKVSYPRFNEMDFEATGTDLEAKDIYGVRGKVSGRAQLIQTTTSTRLWSELNLGKAEMNLGQFEGHLARSIRVIDGGGEGDVLEVSKDTVEQNSFVEKLEMDLTINLPPSGTWVRGMGLEAEIAGSLKIEKRPYAPVRFHGGFQTLRGEYKFQDYRMKIVEGELIFPEAPQPEPQLRIVCQKDVKDAIIQTLVTGPLKQPKLVFSSIPSMNQVDILSYLLFDRPAGDLSSNESFQLQDKAASWLGSQTSQLLKRVIGNTLLTPDTIEYRKSSSKSLGSYGNRSEVGIVSIGKYVTPDLYVSFEKEVTGEEGNQVNVEYRLNRHLSIQTEFGGTQQSGIDVFWRYDFGK
jgi:hypothetical protein